MVRYCLPCKSRVFGAYDSATVKVSFVVVLRTDGSREKTTWKKIYRIFTSIIKKKKSENDFIYTPSLS